MSASEKSETKTSQSEVRPRSRSYAPVAGVSMRDLLAAGVAANVISTPPREPDAGQSVARHREAA